MSYIEAGGVRTYYEVDGEGEPAVLLHGGMVPIETWAGQRGALAERYRLYLPERRGHGRTPDVPGPTTYVQMARDTEAFMEAVDVPAAHIIGWSDGGIIALEMALTRPELIRKMVLIGTNAHINGARPEGEQWVNNLTPDTMPAFLREPYERLSPDGPEHFPVMAEKIIALWKAEPRHDPSELSGITVPTLLILGDNDMLTLEHAAEMQRAIPNAQLAVIPGADHGVMFQKPDLVNRLILDFLA
jgi:pimeloyl-ACP methyl ester carboxylesterase